MHDQNDRRSRRRWGGATAGRSALAAVAAALLVTAVGSTTAAAAPEQQDIRTVPACSTRAERADQAVVQAWLEALTSGRAAEGLEEYWDPAGTVVVPAALPYGGTYAVADQGAYGAAVNETWDTSALGTPTLYASCGKVFAEARWNVTARATGRTVDQPLVEVFELENQRITKDTLYYFDTDELRRAITP